MTVYIKAIPTLRGRAAREFIRQAEENETTYRASIDFTEQVKIARAILEKSEKYKKSK